MLTYGFYNSLNHDRRYNAIQMSSIFDGIIRDGIFMSIGDRFKVTADGEDMLIRVGSGRAWFNHTWTLNDSTLVLELPPAELLLNRYDAVVLEVNASVSVRANEIKIVSGKPSSKPEYPVMEHSELVHQYPLAYIYVAENVTSIRQADVTSMVGKDSAPYVTGILDTIDIEDMVAQWEDQWKKFFEMQMDDMNAANAIWKEQWIKWFTEYSVEMDEASERWKNLWHEWYHMYTDSSSEEFGNWKNQQKADFIEWFNSLKDMLTEQVEAMMAAEIEELKKRMSDLERFKRHLSDDHAIYHSIDDSNGDPITDHTGDPIGGRILFVTGNGDISNLTVDFDSEDALNPTEYQKMPLVKSGSKLKTLMRWFSIGTKNTRYLFRRVLALQSESDQNRKEISDIKTNMDSLNRSLVRVGMGYTSSNSVPANGTVTIDVASVKNIDPSRFLAVIPILTDASRGYNNARVYNNQSSRNTFIVKNLDGGNTNTIFYAYVYFYI